MNCLNCGSELEPEDIEDAEVGDSIDCMDCGTVHEVTAVDIASPEPVKLRALTDEEVAEMEDDEDEFEDDEDEELDDEDEE